MPSKPMWAMVASDLDVETTPLEAPQTQEHLEIQAP